MKSCHISFATIFTYIYHQHLKKIVTIFIKTPHVPENMTIWPRDFTKETGWVNNEEPRTDPREIFLDPLNMHRHTTLLKFTKKQLNPLYTYYLICYLQTFLRIFIFGYPGSNISINSSTSYRTSNPCVTLFSLKSPTNYGLRIIMMEPSVGIINSITVGHIDIL